MLQFGCLLLLLASCVGEPVLKGGSKALGSLELQQRSAGPAPLKLLGPVFEALVASPDALQESVVFFCVDWMEQCKALQDDFRRTARALADELNAQHLLEPQIRLAEVNCAEDKVLCNRQQVESYPSIVRYIDGAREQAWEGSLGKKYKQNLKAMQTWLRAHVGAEVEHARRAQPAEAPDEEMSSLDAFRLAASAGALIALTIVVIKSGMDMIRSTQMAVRVSRRISPEEDIKDRAKAEDTARAASIERRLPQEWVSQREKMEL
mmetsp:Transcript_51087/g.91738  ORF Transcript_51087/g.91738 Transcript_51087/m.91738 type:complete len:264 (-) Transcript_51087:89-880(-)|eukprot:CAMPEP_0197656804 /NCGR_PEP_ID=MMETSP1338-20131121/43450_1 /TAXON_ID=43686 ORGANISM="Pelagodinium beii, Strain RCC1491" /NCGR_SAMPLE_ID=MMETSP1338 /ASSEMBLY_ACC=CAM_ASM_000754 /LENGTH=263 /DNA_ID=CAMNT_0043232993 /DNA_START=158 /DNA_END=949 /DNA_ORIENTATION=-